MIIMLIMISMKDKTFLLRNFDESLHAAAKTVAAHEGVSLNKFILDAIQARCLLVAHKDKITERVLKNIERANKQPARS